MVNRKLNMLCIFDFSPVNCVGFHPEGQKIVSGQWDSTIKIWDVFYKSKLAVMMNFLLFLINKFPKKNFLTKLAFVYYNKCFL